LIKKPVFNRVFSCHRVNIDPDDTDIPDIFIRKLVRFVTIMEHNAIQTLFLFFIVFNKGRPAKTNNTPVAHPPCTRTLISYYVVTLVTPKAAPGIFLSIGIFSLPALNEDKSSCLHTQNRGGTI